MKTSESRIVTAHMGSLLRGEVLSVLLIRKDDEGRLALDPYRYLFAERFGAESDGGPPRADSGGGEGSA